MYCHCCAIKSSKRLWKLRNGAKVSFYIRYWKVDDFYAERILSLELTKVIISIILMVMIARHSLTLYMRTKLEIVDMIRQKSGVICPV